MIIKLIRLPLMMATITQITYRRYNRKLEVKILKVLQIIIMMYPGDDDL